MFSYTFAKKVKARERKTLQRREGKRKREELMTLPSSPRPPLNFAPPLPARSPFNSGRNLCPALCESTVEKLLLSLLCISLTPTNGEKGKA